MAIEKSILQSVKDVKVTSCVLISQSFKVPVDLLHLIVEINYFEDIFSNCLSGNLVINDSIGLHSKMSWTGEEFLSLEFSKPAGESVSNPITKTFKIYSTSHRKLTNDTNENYVLNFCSDELLLSQKLRISKTFKNKRISDIVKIIAFDYLKINPKDFPDSHIETTYGMYNITIPNMKPFQAINWLCNIAVSDLLQKNRESGATYLFWQTRNGYYFKSILNIFNDKENNYYRGWANAGYYWYGVKNDTFDDIGAKEYSYDRNRPHESQNIIIYEDCGSFDSLENIRTGKFSNKSLGIDYLTRKTTPIVFDYDKYFGSGKDKGYVRNNIELYKSDGKYSILSDTKDRLGKTQNEYEDSILKIFPSTTGQIQNNFVKDNKPDTKDYNIEYTMPYRIAQFSLLSHNRVKIAIPGDHNIAVGMLIQVFIPQMNVIEDKKIKVQDKFLSGFYLITAVRHIINSFGDYSTILEIRKDSYYTMPDTRISSEGLQQKIK